jgi:hypothetical protein
VLSYKFVPLYPQAHIVVGGGLAPEPDCRMTTTCEGEQKYIIIIIIKLKMLNEN